MKKNIRKGKILTCFSTVLLILMTTTSAVDEKPILDQQPKIISPTAALVQPSYVIELQVGTEGEVERKEGFAKALEQLLIKNSNNSSIATLPAIKTALSTPSSYVERYTYVSHGLAAAAVGPQALFLQIQFNEASIAQLLQQAISIAAPNTINTAMPIINQSKKIILRITNVNGLSQHAEVMQYLTTFSKIAQMDLLETGPAEIKLSVNIISGDQGTLITALNTQNKLVRNTTSSLPGIDLDYKYIPSNLPLEQRNDIK